MQLKFLNEADMARVNSLLEQGWTSRKPIAARTGDSQTFLILLETHNDVDGDREALG